MAERRPAFYAARPGGWRDWWTLLHPPYTVWHLSYAVIGGALAPRFDGIRMLATVLAFFLAVGVSAHALDELHGRPLHTQLSGGALKAASALGLSGAVALGVIGLWRVGLPLVPFLVVGPFLVLGYNLELFGGRLHNDIGFAAAWGAFPLLVGYVAQAGTLGVQALVGALAAFALSYAQRALSSPARMLRRHVDRVEGSLALDDGSVQPLDHRTLLAPLEKALYALSWSTPAFALALAVSRLPSAK